MGYRLGRKLIASIFVEFVLNLLLQHRDGYHRDLVRLDAWLIFLQLSTFNQILRVRTVVMLDDAIREWAI